MTTTRPTRGRLIVLASTALALGAALVSAPSASGLVASVPTTNTTDGSAPAGPDSSSRAGQGRWILFERYELRESGGPALKNLFLVRPDGTGERPLMPEPIDPEANIVHASWSPDGRLVVFEVLEADDDPSATVWVVGLDGKDPQRIARCSADPCRSVLLPRLVAGRPSDRDGAVRPILRRLVLHQPPRRHERVQG